MADQPRAAAVRNPAIAPADTPVGTCRQPLQAGLTDDAFLGGALHILQPEAGYRAGVDAVLLAATVSSHGHKPLRILDLGAGVGTVGLSVAHRIAQAHVTLLESEPLLADLAAQNIARNRLADRVRSVGGDVAAPAAVLQTRGLEADGFDCVIANPPYHAEGRGTPSRARIKAAAHAMPEDALAQWVRAMARYAKPGGTATMIHKADALGDVLAAFAGRFGALRILPIHPRVSEPAIRVLVSGTKGSRAALTLLPGFVLHGEGQAFTPAATAILKEGGPLAL